MKLVVLTCKKLGYRRLLHDYILHPIGVELQQWQLSTEQATVVSLHPHLLKLDLIDPLRMHVSLRKHVLVT